MNHINRPARAGILLLALFAVAAARAQEGTGTNYVELKRIAEAEQAKAFASKAKAISVAQKFGMPIRTVHPTTGRIMEIMRLDENGVPLYFATRNANAAITTRAARVFPGGGAGLSLTGSGIVFGVWDGGTARATHQELTGRVTTPDGAAHGGHPTHVIGTMIASGVWNLAKGMSYQGTVRSYDWNSDTSEAAAEAAGGTPIRLSNHSYGPVTGWSEEGDWVWYGTVGHSTVEDSRFGMYTSECQTWDNIAVNAPNYLSVWAAGNDRNEGPTSQPVFHWYWDNGWKTTSSVSRNLDGNGTGYDTVSGTGVAKNTLTVGAVDDVLSYSGPGSVTMSDFSCWGPTDDGRIKPDVVGNGVEVLSSYNNSDTGYANSWGTSMAAPNVTGSLGLLVQHYSNTHSGGVMRSATIRGLVIHTADECGTTTGPDYKFGWGLMNTEKAAQVISDDVSNPEVIRESALPNAGVHTYYVTSDGSTPLRFTLCWTDPAGTPAQTSLNPRSARLVNDLDMRVQIGGTTYYPWNLSYSSPSAAATQGENNIDNVEVIDIAAPAAGTYKITIDHDGTLSSAQNYSLIVTGPPKTPIMTNFTINGTWITGRNSTNGTVTINTPAPAGGFKVYPRVVAIAPAGFNINTVVIPEGQTTKTFPIVGTGDVNVNTPYSVWMDAGYKSLGVAGTLVPLRINALTVTPNPVNSGGSVNMHVGLNGPAPVGGLTLTVDRAPTYWIQAPSTVTIPQGQFGATFNIPIRAGLTSTQQGRLSIIQSLQPSGTARLDKLFTINP